MDAIYIKYKEYRNYEEYADMFDTEILSGDSIKIKVNKSLIMHNSETIRGSFDSIAEPEIPLDISAETIFLTMELIYALNMGTMRKIRDQMYGLPCDVIFNIREFVFRYEIRSLEGFSAKLVTSTICANIKYPKEILPPAIKYTFVRYQDIKCLECFVENFYEYFAFGDNTNISKCLFEQIEANIRLDLIFEYFRRIDVKPVDLCHEQFLPLFCKISDYYRDNALEFTDEMKKYIFNCIEIRGIDKSKTYLQIAKDNNISIDLLDYLIGWAV